MIMETKFICFPNQCTQEFWKFKNLLNLMPHQVYIQENILRIIAKSIIKKKLIISFENYDLIKEDLGKVCYARSHGND